jgi:hypothetical protein
MNVNPLVLLKGFHRDGLGIVVQLFVELRFTPSNEQKDTLSLFWHVLHMWIIINIAPVVILVFPTSMVIFTNCEPNMGTMRETCNKLSLNPRTLPGTASPFAVFLFSSFDNRKNGGQSWSR